MTEIKGEPTPGGDTFVPVRTFVLNPKSITMGQLYGQYDINTHEWTDGILSSLVRQGTQADDDNKRWYVLDGPVDAVWIENLNSVLDDNKKLCLSSGEIMTLSKTQTMMFEVADLSVASPATVSRCGMVYLEPSNIGLDPFLSCWMNRQPKLILERHASRLMKLFHHYFLPSIQFLRNELRELVGSVDCCIVFAFLNLMDVAILPLTQPGGKPLPPEDFQNLVPDLLEPWVQFAVIWSVGATCNNVSRAKFSHYMRQRIDKSPGKKKAIKFPPKDSVYDYKLIDAGFSTAGRESTPTTIEWVHWMKTVGPYEIKPDMKFADIEVPMIDNVRCSTLLAMLAFTEHQVLCVGPTGTGKTVTITSKLAKNPPKNFISDFITFSARTTANQTQDLIDAKLDKRRKGIFGPPVMKKQIFFIDDLNMPALEVYGAQPPIELLRQWMDFRGWYDRKLIGEFRNIVDVTFVGAMCPPGGGRNPVSLRLLRHFHYIAFIELEDDSRMRIFTTIVRSWLARCAMGAMLPLEKPLVEATIAVYVTILAELLPTPAKTHYTYNLRDLSKVFQGMLMCEISTITDDVEVLRLWHHECCRVFQDRLVNDEDRQWFDDLLNQKLKQVFKVQPIDIIGDGTVLYTDMVDENDNHRYVYVNDREALDKLMGEFLDDYNADSTKPMRLVLFLDAVRHLCRIARIIRTPMGNALLLGMSGSGRSSLTRLASHMADFICFAIELTKSYDFVDWREDIKQLMLKAGLEDKGTVFLFSDTQVKNESFLEDLNNILNSGDVPNIYAVDELELIYKSMKGAVNELGLDPTRANLFAAYQKSVRSTLHVVVTMSPIGETFRARLRQFPALVNCCTIDWFSAWPEAALKSVAYQYFEDITDLGSTKIVSGVVDTCQYMHQSVVDASVLYEEELSRTNYVTPTSYLELLTSYTGLVIEKREFLTTYTSRLQAGLETLLATVEIVEKLQKEMEIMSPKLKAASLESMEMLKIIEKDTIVANETMLQVQAEEKVAAEKAAETQAIAEDAQRDLDAAMPMLRQAEASLKALNKNDISEVRAFKRPPPGVLLVMEAMCIVKDIKPVKVTLLQQWRECIHSKFSCEGADDAALQGLTSLANYSKERIIKGASLVAGPNPGEKVIDFWDPARSMLANAEQFMQSLINFDKESITEAVQQRLLPYIENPNFQPAKIVSVSKACTSLCMWVHAIYKYYFVNKAVAPKKAALAKAKQELAATEAVLAAAKDRLKKVTDRLANLEQKLKATEAKKRELEESMRQCEERMNRAVRLVNGLADERVRWIATVADIKEQLVRLVGDILMSAGSVAYITPFNDTYRRRLLRTWVGLMEERGVPHSEHCDPVAIMGDPVAIRQWQLWGLPRDALSVESAVLVFGSKRWPLFIDPQGQANRWIKNMGKDSGIIIAKLSDKELQLSLESAIRFGKMLLIENIGKELDPLLDPVLMRQTYMHGMATMIRLGDTALPFDPEFRLFMTTKLPNPGYPPEVCIKVLLVDFALIPSGLEDQLLALVVMSERPDLEALRSNLIVQSAQMRSEQKDIETKILEMLTASAKKGNPVDDVDLINTLENSKAKSQEITEKVIAADKTQIQIDTTRHQYIPVATRAQIIFFCVLDLAKVDPMYQYSLDWFTGIFIASMENTEKEQGISDRVKTINDHFTFSAYVNVCRSLFEKHKRHFAFLLSARILMNENKINAQEWQHFLAGAPPPREVPNPASAWLSEKAWKEIQSLELLPLFAYFVADFTANVGEFRRFFDSQTPETEKLTPRWEGKLDDFQRLLLLKALRPDKVMNAVQNFISKNLGQRFIEPYATDLSNIYEESTCTTPLIFVLSQGTDPAQDLYKFAAKQKFTSKLFVISLGQGQGPRAEAMMQEAIDSGYWVFFQNCHLSPSWMPRLEYLIETMKPDHTNKDFRIWLTSMPSPNFPVTVLQNGNKMTMEPPRGIKANMITAYSHTVADMKTFFEGKHPKLPVFKSLLFALCLFHGICLERRKFGPLGFNIAYEFTSGDLLICISQLKMFLLEYNEVPFKVLTYTAGQINYGGRVTDDWDRRCIMNVLMDYYNPKVMQSGYSFDSRKQYRQLRSKANLEDYVQYLKTLPLNDDPELFGLHSNADISSAQQETLRCLSTLLLLQPRQVGSAAASQEDVVSERAHEILNEIAPAFDFKAISEKYPVSYEESLNTVLVQEVIRYNPLLKVIQTSLVDLLKALKGLVVMSGALEDLNFSLFTNSVPRMWQAKAYPSLKPLGAWVKDLNARAKFLEEWYDKGIPVTFWISGFFFPQAFLTGTLQNFARKHVLSIDSIDFKYMIMEQFPTTKCADGAYIYGLYLEGSRWDPITKSLGESKPKELYTEFPCIWMLPEQHHVEPKNIYICPVYKTLTRAGTLSTTGHSTNYVVAMEIPSKKDQNHWIKRGVALICALDY